MTHLDFGVGVSCCCLRRGGAKILENAQRRESSKLTHTRTIIGGNSAGMRNLRETLPDKNGLEIVAELTSASSRRFGESMGLKCGTISRRKYIRD